MERFISMVAEILFIDESDINMKDKFRDYDEWDSLSALSFLAMLNDEYEVVIPRRVFDDMTTLEDVFNYVCANEGSNNG